jgi:hypothetical protein
VGSGGVLIVHGSTASYDGRLTTGRANQSLPGASCSSRNATRASRRLPAVGIGPSSVTGLQQEHEGGRFSEGSQLLAFAAGTQVAPFAEIEFKPTSQSAYRPRPVDHTQMVVLQQLPEQPHKLVAIANRLLSRTRPADDGRVLLRRQRCLSIQVAPPSLNRALRVMDALLTAFEKHGLKVEVTDVVKFDERGYRIGAPDDRSNATRVLVDGESIYLRLVEKCSPAEKAGLGQGPVASAKNSLASMNRPRPTRIANGILELWLEAGDLKSVWKDGKRRRLEDALSKFVGAVFALADGLKKARVERERCDEERREAQRQRWEAERRAAEERQRVEQFLKVLDRWRLARDTRAYVAEAHEILAAAGLGPPSEDPLYRSLEWALAYANQVDPLGKLHRAPDSPSTARASSAFRRRDLTWYPAAHRLLLSFEPMDREWRQSHDLQRLARVSPRRVDF